MVLICWSAQIFSKQFCLWISRLFLLLFLILSFFRRVLLEGQSSHLLGAVQINWPFLCQFPHYSGVSLLPTSVACCGVSPKTHGSCVTAKRDLYLTAAGSGTQQNSTRQCSKGFENSGSPGYILLLDPLGSTVQMLGWCPRWNSWELREVLLPCSHGFWNLRISLHNRTAATAHLTPQ